MATGTGVLLAIWEPRADRLSCQTRMFDVDWDELTAELGFWIVPWAEDEA